MLILYLTGFIVSEQRSNPNNIVTDLNVVYYVVGIFSPLVQMFHAMLLSLNIFSILCVGSPPVKAPAGSWSVYGAPVTLLIIQNLFMISFFLWTQHRSALGPRKKRTSSLALSEDVDNNMEPDVVEEEKRVITSHDGVKLRHVYKIYHSSRHGNVEALKNVNFGIRLGEVFALVGPNGAGKSTTVSLLRGDIKPTYGLLYVLDKSLMEDLAGARFHLGVCPQHDALETLTVREHLEFYAKIRGVPPSRLQPAVNFIIDGVGLKQFADSPTADKLSGGNKRRLSLAIALVGDPEVLLLDEPTTGIDPMGKRAFWNIAKKFQANRAILLTTHSMEEADALASRVGVLSKKLLEIGTIKELRDRHGRHLNVQLVLKSSPGSTDKEMSQLEKDIMEGVRGARLLGTAYHGILRFMVSTDVVEVADDGTETNKQKYHTTASLFLFLEENKDRLGIEHFSVSLSSFDEVFLNILAKHNVKEEEIRGAQVKQRDWGRVFPWVSPFKFLSSR